MISPPMQAQRRLESAGTSRRWTTSHVVGFGLLRSAAAGIDAKREIMNDKKIEEQNKAIVRRWVDEVWNQGKREAIDELAAPDFVMHYFAMNSDVDLALYKELFALFTTAFVDVKLEIEDLLVEGDKVTARIFQQGTHVGELMGVPPSGKRATQRALAIYRVKDGKLVESWAAEIPWPVTLAALHQG